MAASAKFMSFLLLLTLFSLQIHARESKFFSKVTSVKSDNVKETTIPNKEETPTKQEQEPVFIPQTQNGYGLYGHETGQLPPATTSLTGVNGAPYTATPTNAPYKNEFEDEESLNKFLSSNDDTKKYYSNNNENTRDSYKNSYYSTKENENTRDNYKNSYYSTKENENTRDSYKNSYYSTKENGNTNNNYYDTKNSYEADLTAAKEVGRGYTTLAEQNNYYTGGNRYNGERQGMSDTRYMENGKYSYYLNSEKYSPNQYGNTKGVAPRNWYGNRGYYSNNENSFERSNSMDGYQNEESFHEGQP